MGILFKRKRFSIQFLSYDTSKRVKLQVSVFSKEIVMSSNYKKNIANKMSEKKLNLLPKIWPQVMCCLLRPDALNFYRSISGFTGHPVKNQMAAENYRGYLKKYR